MKRFYSKFTLALIFSLILLVTAFAITAFASPVSDGDITWKYSSNDTDMTATITGVTINNNLDKTVSFAIPETLEIEKNGELVSYTVVKIGDSAFKNIKKVFGKLTLPSTLTSIGSSAFLGTYICDELIIPEGVNYIGANAFQNCVGLNKVTLPTTLTTLNTSTFDKCLALIEINTENITLFGEKCFYDCRSLLQIDLSSVEDIGKNAFDNCDSLSGTYDLSVIDTVNHSVDLTAFNNCDRITGFVIPNIDSNILPLFTGCISLKEVTANSDNKAYTSIDGVLFSKNKQTLVYYPVNKSGDTYTVPSSVKEIGNTAFANNKKLQTVIVPETITSIGVGAFTSSVITSFYIPDSVTTINVDTFKECSQVKWIVIGSGVSSVGVDAFKNTSSDLIVYCKNDKLVRPANIRTFILTSEYQCVDHRYGYLDTKPTCDQYGYNKCVICNRLAFVQELGHSGPIIKKSALSCTTDEYSIVRCVTCKQEVKIVSQKSTGHTSHFTTVLPTDTTPGYVLGNCDVCRETYLESYTPHSDLKCSTHVCTSIVVSQPGCRTNGLELVYCKNCGKLVENRVTPKTSCNYVHEMEIASTCTVNGQRIEVCTVCGTKKYTTLELTPHTHSWYTVASSKGIEYSSCSVCGTFESREVDYSLFHALLAKVSKYYESYYAPDTVAMLKPILDNKDMNMTQEAVDYNTQLLSNILSNIKYNVKDIPVVFIEQDSFISSSEYKDARFYVAYIDENGNYQVEAIERNGQIKIRGNSTANKVKNPYNIKFSSKVDLFGLGAGKKYCLMANLFDQTLLRNAVAIDLAQSLGLDYTSKYTMVEVYLNGECDGLYMLTTPVDVGENRVDIDEENDFLLEITTNHAKDNEHYKLTTDNMFAPFQNLKLIVEDTDKMSAEAFSKLNSTFWQVNFAVYSGDWETIQKHVDVESMAKYYLLHEYLKALDYCYDSTRFYYEDGKLHGGPVWDFDYGLGNIEVGLGGTHDSTADGYHNKTASYAEKSEGIPYDENDPEGIWASTTGYWANSQWGGCGNGYFKQLYEYSPEFVELLSKTLKDYNMEFTLLYEDIIISKKEVYQNAIDKHDKNPDYTAARMRNWQIYNIISDVDNACGGHIEISHNHAINYLREWLQRRHAWMITAYNA